MSYTCCYIAKLFNKGGDTHSRIWYQKLAQVPGIKKCYATSHKFLGFWYLETDTRYGAMLEQRDGPFWLRVDNNDNDGIRMSKHNQTIKQHNCVLKVLRQKLALMQVSETCINLMKVSGTRFLRVTHPPQQC